MKSDQELIDAINKGHLDAFEVLYYRYRDWIFSLALRFTGSQNDALDVLQETNLYFLGKFPGFKLTASITTFFYPAVKHISLNIKQKRSKYISSDGISEEIIDLKQKDTHADSGELEAVLKVLPDDLREVLVMKYVDEMSQDEIAQALNTPLGTVKSRLHRALQTLRQDARIRPYFLE